MATINPAAPVYSSNPYVVRPSAVARRDPAANSNTPPVSALGVTDFLDLSPLAVSFLNGGVGTSSDLFGFYLTQAQEEKLAEILARHKGEPLNQQTFNAILDDLAAEGLAPQQLAVQDVLQSFDPLATLLDVSRTANNNGDFFSNTLNLPITSVSFPNEQANINAYLLRILNQFLGISIVH